MGSSGKSAGSGYLAIVNYATGATTVNRTGSASLTSWVAIDATNLTATFITKSSSVVGWVSIYDQPDLSANAYAHSLALTTHGTSTAVAVLGFPIRITNALTETVTSRITLPFHVTGLAAGTSYSWDLSYASQSTGDNGNFQYGSSAPGAIFIQDAQGL
jgi:hypothetical protein